MHSRALGKLLVGNMLVTAATRFPNRTAFVCVTSGRRMTFRKTNERCNRLASGLLARGFRKGDVIGFLCSNRAEMPEIYFALAKTGIIGIPLNYRLASAEVVELLKSMGARGLIYEYRFAECALEVRNKFPEVTHFVSIGDEAPSVGIGYEGLLAASSDAEPATEIDEADPFYFNLTSGTTGLPKAYILTQFNNAVAGQFGPAFDITSGDVVMTTFPMFGRVGVAWMLCSIIHGLPNVLVNFEPAAVLQAIATERVTIVNLVSTMAVMLMADDKLSRSDLGSLRAIVFAGAMLPAPIREQTAAKLCSNIYEYYGMQESGMLVHSTPEDRVMRPDSVGRVSLFAEIRIVGADGESLPAGEIGEIIGRSPGAVTEYFDNPEKSAETFRDGWVHTGDLGSLDAEGFLFIRGRKKDMIITGGQNVHSAEVEEILVAHPDVADVGVIGLADELWGEQVCAVIVPRAGVAPDPEDLTAFCKARLAGFKTPKQFFLQSDPLPRTPTGKIQKFLLVERYQHRDGGSA